MNMLVTVPTAAAMTALSKSSRAEASENLTELRSLYEVAIEIAAELKPAQKQFNEAEKMLLASIPRMPDTNQIDMPPEVQEYFDSLTVAEFKKLPPDSPYRVWDERRQAAYDQARNHYDAERRRIEAKIGFKKITKAWSDICSRQTANVLAILEHPAAGLEAARIKVQAIRLTSIHECFEVEALDGLMLSIDGATSKAHA